MNGAADADAEAAEAPGGALPSEPRPLARVEAMTAEQTRDVARRLGTLLQPGDLVILSGELGAGKTTFTQGLAEGLGVRGPVTSPTFVIARVHPPLKPGAPGAERSKGVPLVHVDAYRLGSLVELDDLDLDASVEESVTVVEWGEGKAEVLSGDRVVVRIERARGAEVADDDRRVVEIEAHGAALTERLRAGFRAN